MADLKIPNLNKYSENFIFKKKLKLRRKSKIRLLKEAFAMFLVSFLIIFLIISIPNKNIIYDNFFINLQMLYELIIKAFLSLYEIGLLFFIVLSSISSIILILGAFLRITKILRRKTKKISYK